MQDIQPLCKHPMRRRNQGADVFPYCRKDMLSMVQSSIGEGQDSAQTLSRLMDWADARQVIFTVDLI